MADFRPRRDRALLDLDEITDAHIVPQIRPRPQPRERADDHVIPHHRAVDMAERLDMHPVADGHVTAEKHTRLDDDVTPEHGIRREKNTVGVD